MTRLSERFPDISFIMEMFREMRSQGVEVDGESKYYPNTLLLAVLFRLQARQEGPFKKAGEELEERSSLVELLGYFWHQLDSVAVILREGLKGETREEVSQGIEESRVRIAERLGFEEADVPLASVSELRGEEEQLRIDDHCPDFVVVVDRAHKAVVLFILGSRGYPGPRGPLDFVMDFSLSTVPYLGGEAHSGILKGAANLEKAALPCLLQQLSLNQGFSLLFVGYSLGAGIAQLLTVSLQHQQKDSASTGVEKEKLPPGTKLRTLSFGCPPIFRSPELACMDNILDVLHHNDGISGISLRGLSKLHRRKRGLAKLKLHRRTLFGMALGKKNKTDGEGDQLTLPEEEDLDADDEPSSPGDHQESSDAEAEAAQDEVDNNDNRPHAEKEPHKLAKEEEGDKVDGEKELPRRRSLLEQMVARSLNIDPQHPSQPPILGSPDMLPDPEEEEKKGEEDSGKNAISSLGESFLASIASLRSQPVTPGLWSQVEASLKELPDPPYPKTGKLGSRLVLVKKKKGVRSARIFRGPDQTGPFSEQIRLKQGMFNDHMPYSYTGVFTGLGDNGASIPLQVLDFDENSNQVANSPLGKEELAEAISGEESGYSSLG